MESKVDGGAATNAWLSALAAAAGDEELAERFGDSMMRDWLLSRRWVLDAADDSDGLHGATGEW
jgi:hypothetical protein